MKRNSVPTYPKVFQVERKSLDELNEFFKSLPPTARLLNVETDSDFGYRVFFLMKEPRYATG